MYSLTSSAIIRPSGPVPTIEIDNRSSPFSFATVHASGEAIILPELGAAVATGVAGGAAAGGSATGAAGAAFGAGGASGTAIASAT
jgi:hypothetical protein